MVFLNVRTNDVNYALCTFKNANHLSRQMVWNGQSNGVEWAVKWCGMDSRMVWNGQSNGVEWTVTWCGMDSHMVWNGQSNGVEWTVTWCGMDSQMVWNGQPQCHLFLEMYFLRF